MNLQYTTYQGQTGVFIEMEDWKKLKNKVKFLSDTFFNEDVTDERLYNELQESIKEVKKAKLGEIKLKSANDLLNEL